MTAGNGFLSRRLAPDSPSVFVLTILVLLLAFAASLLVAVVNTPYFEFVNGFFGARNTEARGLLFSSWLLLIGGPIAVWRPRTLGFRLGETRRHGRLVAGTVAAAGVVTALVLAGTGRTPYSDASLLIETIVVPFTEELVFRGVLLTVLLMALARLHPPRTALVLAVLFDGIAFGLAHVANAMSLELGFVVSQAAFASVLGVACAYLMARTRSIYPAMLLHAVVNGVVVAF